jgi:hypothetical protein
MTIRKTVTARRGDQQRVRRARRPPLRRVAHRAVFENPLAGQPAGANLKPLIDYSLEARGLAHQGRANRARREPAQLRTYTKAAVVGIGGDLEHGRAMIHPRLAWRCAARSSAAASSFRGTPR